MKINYVPRVQEKNSYNKNNKLMLTLIAIDMIVRAFKHVDIKLIKAALDPQ